MHRFGYVVAVGTALTMSCAISAAPQVTGQWGGDRALLTLDAAGGRIEYDCGSGTIDAPLQLDAQGRFSVNGKHEQYSSGPTVADAEPASRAAVYRGKIEGDRMSLTVQVAGDSATSTFNLVRGQRVKLIRCR